MEEDKDDSIIQRITRHLTGEATVEEEQQLSKWRAESADHEATFNRYLRAYQLMLKRDNPDDRVNSIDLDTEWNNLSQRLPGRDVASRSLPIRSNQSLYWRIAAGIALLIGAGFIVNYFLSSSSNIVVQTSAQVQHVVLPDGSQVDLNRNSRLTYAKDFGKENRALQLSGEGYFEVVPDPQLPFTIKAGDTQVKVVGTSFNVQAYEHSERAEVSVATGVVEFATNKEKRITLHPGQTGVFTVKTRELSALPNDVNYLSWKTRKFVFDSTPLTEVINALNKVYGNRIKLGPAVAKTCEISVTFDQQELDAILNVLKNTLNLTYRVNGDTVEIVDAACE